MLRAACIRPLYCGLLVCFLYSEIDCEVAVYPIYVNIVSLVHNVSFWAQKLTHYVSFWIEKTLK